MYKTFWTFDVIFADLAHQREAYTKRLFFSAKRYSGKNGDRINPTQFIENSSVFCCCYSVCVRYFYTHRKERWFPYAEYRLRKNRITLVFQKKKWNGFAFRINCLNFSLFRKTLRFDRTKTKMSNLSPASQHWICVWMGK